MKSTAGRPHADSKLARFIEKRILDLRPRKTQVEIAAEAGFPSRNMVNMIKVGASRLPLDRVPALSKALEVDPARLFLMAVEQQDNALALVVMAWEEDTVERIIRRYVGRGAAIKERIRQLNEARQKT
jgi:hypothetical protein